MITSVFVDFFKLSYFFPFVMFFISVYGIVFNSRSIIITLMSVELMLLSINLVFILSSCLWDDILGQVFAIFVLTIAAAESAIGLGILVVYYRIRGIISINSISVLKG